MKHIITLPMICLVVAVTTPVMAQSPDDDLSPMQKGARDFMQELMQDMAPALKGLRGLTDDLGPSVEGFMTHMGPALRDLLSQIEDWSVYAPPEILDNGDIIIRRKPDVDPDPEDVPDMPVPDANGQIEL